MPEGDKIEHESFGFIRASRVQGHAQLFDSAVRHQHYVTVTIGRASQERQYSESQIYGRDELIEVALSESQFAQFITSMNVGSGAPCTLMWVDGKRVESPPADINTRETFENEVKVAAEKATESLDDSANILKQMLATGKANKSQMSALLSRIEDAQRDLKANMPFMMKQFAEGIEKLTDRAKMDLNAHATMLGQRLSLADEPAGGGDRLSISMEG